ncbi:MAG: hypothetical protein HZB72_04280 [Burkholderiales bacterium]|nr:hypothetical protein [Burkholderiales bacterium]
MRGVEGDAAPGTGRRHALDTDGAPHDAGGPAGKPGRQAGGGPGALRTGGKAG